MKILQKRILMVSAAGVLLLGTTTFSNIAQASNVVNYTTDNYTYSTEDVEKLLEDTCAWQDISLTFNSTALVEDAIKLEEEADKQSALEEEVIEEEKKSEIIIAQVDYYLNIRSSASEDSEVLGKLYNNGIGVIMEEKDGWYKIKSGSVVGYVKADYVLAKEEARKKADEVGKHLATVTTTTLKVREKAKEDATVLTLVGEGQILSVKKESENWVKFKVDDYIGYVSSEYVKVYIENEEAESIEEEQARLEREEQAKREVLLEQQTALNNEVHTSSKSTSNKTSSKTSKKTVSSVGSSSSQSNSSTSASLGQQVVNYALQFKGNRYVYGGTSLTNGTDCSGFVMSVYKNFGFSLPRTSSEQGVTGKKIASISQAQPGDLIAYYGHIGIYIGDGKLIHASSPESGIIISNVNYRKIKSIRRIL
ncbi:C40 family peptidase [Anaerosporobacter sp.]|uniref:C40 family peptidase n=1 Tax=Anaerosporobacter sp. TaxID=1872529 RepID=UPI00286F6246|nr:NlpC/P60 family protein [Anaerosporobacter sp.]